MKRALIALFGVATALAACGGNTGATNPSTGGTSIPTPPADLPRERDVMREITWRPSKSALRESNAKTTGWRGELRT